MTTGKHAVHRTLFTGLKPLLVLFCLAGAQTVHAEDSSWYTVELIIFQQNGDPNQIAEVWPNDPGRPNFAGSVMLHTTSIDGAEQPPATNPDLAPVQNSTGQATADTGNNTPLLPFSELDPASWTLRQIDHSLTRGGYRVLYHTAWHQPLTENTKGTRLHIVVAREQSGEPLADAGQTESYEQDVLPIMATDLEQELSTTPLLDGTVRLHRGRHLHLEFDLLYSPAPVPVTVEPAAVGLEPVDPEAGIEIRSYRLREKRRIRTDKLHYFDHPMFAVIARVTPWELPSDEKARDPQETEENRREPVSAQPLPLQ